VAAVERNGLTGEQPPPLIRGGTEPAGNLLAAGPENQGPTRRFRSRAPDSIAPGIHLSLLGSGRLGLFSERFSFSPLFPMQDIASVKQGEAEPGEDN
jgi:hypothetical protein